MATPLVMLPVRGGEVGPDIDACRCTIKRFPMNARCADDNAYHRSADSLARAEWSLKHNVHHR